MSVQQSPNPSTPSHGFPDAIEGDHWIENLRDGTPVLIRPLTSKDRDREIAFLNRLSDKTKRLRFLGDFREASPLLIEQLMKLDYHDKYALVALIHEGGKLQEIGVSRYYLTTDGKSCECAVTVADAWQGLGLGVLLMQHLIHIARRNGFKRLFSIDASSNEPMRDLASYLGFRRQADPSDPTQVLHTLDL